MKKVKVKQKQKQKQSQTVNINLGNVLKKKSKPKRKPQVNPPPIAQAITFNAPPIREYVDTSLYNIPSRLENPLLARQTVNPILPANPIQPVNTVGPIQSNNPLFVAQQKKENIMDDIPMAEAYYPEYNPELPGYNPEFNVKRKKNQLTPYEIELRKAEAKQRNELKKAETIRRNELLKAEKKKLNEEKILQKKREKELQKEKDDSSQTNMLNYVIKPSVTIKKDIQNYPVKAEETPMTIFSAPQQPQTIYLAPPQQETILSELQQPQGIDQNIPRPNIVGPIINKYPVFQERSSTTSSSSQPQTITSEQPPPTNLFSELPQQESITSSLTYNEEPLITEVPPMTEEELARNREINKAPTKKRPPSEEGKKIKIRPIKLDADGNPIKKPKQKRSKLDENIPLPPL